MKNSTSLSLSLSRVFKLAAGFLLMMSNISLNSQGWYGQLTYPHDSTILSSAKRTVNNQGYVMAGFRPVRQTGSASPDFVIDKVDGNGAFSTPVDFSNEYQILYDPNCSGSYAAVNNCSGISIIETNNLGGGETYALAGTFSTGVFFSTLDAFGFPINTWSWSFPGVGIDNHKPGLRESASNPGDYTLVDIDSIAVGPQWVGTVSITMAAMGGCQGVNLTVNQLSTNINTVCSAQSVASGSNARTITSLSRAIKEGKKNIIFPNPAETTLFLSATDFNSSKIDITIINPFGKRVFSTVGERDAENTIQIELGRLNLAKGIYTVIAKDHLIQQTYKFVKK